MNSQTILRNLRSVGGTTLVVLGMFFLYGNLAAMLAWANHVLTANGSQVPRMLSIVLAITKLLQAHTFSQQRILDELLQHILISSRPLVLIMVGMAAAADSWIGQGGTLRKS
jgi:hypothetical protein